MKYLCIISFIICFISANADDKVDSLLLRGDELLMQAQLQEALAIVDSAIEHSLNNHLRSAYYQALNQKGYILTRMGRYDSAFRIHTSILEESTNLGLTDLEFSTRYYLGVNKLFMSEFEDSERMFTEVVDYLRIDDTFNKELLGRSLTNLAFLAFRKQRNTIAKQYIRESIQYLENTQQQWHSAPNFSLMGHILYHESDTEGALTNYQKALEIYRNTDRRLNLSGIYLGLSSIFQVRGDFSEAKLYLDSALNAANGPYLGRELQAVYDQYFRFLYNQGDYQKAIEQLLLRDHIRDSIRDTEQVLRVVQLESNSDKKLEEMRVNMLQRQLIAQQENNRVQIVWIFIIVIVSLYLLVFIFVYRRLIQDKNRSQQQLLIKNNELEDKNQQIAKAQQLLIKSEKMALLGRISAGIAHELNTPISAIKGNLDLLNNLNHLEFERIRSLIPDLNEQVIRGILDISEKSILINRVIPDPGELKIRRQKIEQFFADVTIDHKNQVIDYFIELGIFEELHTHYAVYSHPRNTELLEVASYLATRANSIKTSITATGKAMKILGSFKTYSFKRGWKDVNSLNLGSCFNMILQLHKNDLRNINLTKKIEGDVVIEGIQDELDQVWTNLITNSLHAMKYEGELIIEIKGLTNAVSVSIQDSGGGIHLSAGQDIFEPFFTTKAEGEGSGLGLDISKQIIKNHHGSISWQNVNQGAKFTVVLPRSLDRSLIVDE